MEEADVMRGGGRRESLNKSKKEGRKDDCNHSSSKEAPE